MVVSTGDPAGIAPRLLSALLQELRAGEHLLLVGPAVLRDWFEEHRPGASAGEWDWEPAGEISEQVLLSGTPDGRSGAAALAALRQGIRRVRADDADALLTLPVAKAAVREAGEEGFTGQTEYLEERFDTRGLMSFFGDTFNVGLITRHCPLRKVPDRVTGEAVRRAVRTAHRFFVNRGTDSPRFALLGLNPHAGEKGRIGGEDVRTLAPAAESLRKEGIHVEGPVAADGFFPVGADEVDMVLAPYHDQGLAPFKLLHFFTGVHATLGLPVARAGPDHGVAADLVGTGRVDDRSTRHALRWLRRHASI